MMRRLVQFLRQFGRDDRGAVAMVEFVVMIPLIFSCFMMSVEMGIYSMRHTFLERGLDITVRYVRLNTSEDMTHTQLKEMICENAGFLPDCTTELRLEMMPLDPRNFAVFDPQADCVDTSAPILPVRGFTLGEQHELMVLRACYKFNPVFPSTGLGYAFDKDGGGKVRMVSTAAFVQEPG